MNENEITRMTEGDCPLCCKAARELSQLHSELERVESKLTASESTNRELAKLILEAHREVGNGFDMLAGVTWDRIVKTAKGLKLLEALEP